ncbi:MAG: hydantoinase/oxoprolinase family protein [Fimbriimonadales bacterium]|nr:hydantoinase/oxoprolinase family protein [Fimbriimonadales bacterium]
MNPIVLGVDTGGTFTDFVLWREGRLRLLKLPSTPHTPEQAVLAGVARLLPEPPPQGFTLLHGTTVGTNRVLERKGARTAFLTTEGFRDLLFLARQDRKSLYSLKPESRPCLAERALCAELPERLAYDGTVLRALDTSGLERLIRRWKREGVEAVAVCLLFAYANPQHERELKRLLAPHFAVSISSEVAPEFREYERASTTFLNAYLTPPMTRYLATLQREAQGMGASRVLLSHSAGGLMDVESACALPVSTILSGPSAGVMGAWAVGRGVGAHRLLTLDIGGTSTDMALIDREPLRTQLGEIEGMPLRLPRLDVQTIGAGGGSIARLDAAGGLRVGPESAGADPGPAAYGKGEQPTLTDAHLVLGHLLPQTFGFGQVGVDPDLSAKAIEPLAEVLGLSLAEAASAILEQARARMARGLRSVSAGRGVSPEGCTLVAFGGAGGLHLCALARLLGVRQWVAPPDPGVLSAYGLLWMDCVHEARRTVLTPLPDAPARQLEEALLELRAECEAAMRRMGVPVGGYELHPFADLRYEGQSYELTVPLDPARPALARTAFEREHATRYGFTLPERPVELATLRMRAVALNPKPAGACWEPPTGDLRVLPTSATLWLGDKAITAPVIPREALQPDAPVPAPALIVQPDTTLLIEPGWQVSLDARTGVLVGRSL